MKKQAASPIAGLAIVGLFGAIGLLVVMSVHGKLGLQTPAYAYSQPLQAMEGSPEEGGMYKVLPDGAAGVIARGGAKVRTLNDFYALRAYPGAPPMISHVDEQATADAATCLSCHERGGFVPQYNAYSPITPHPAMENCQQCHLPMDPEPLFVDSGWSRPAGPDLGRTAIAGGPVPIPHTLQMRGNCQACHVGPQAVVEIKTKHPERTNCLQCHVPQDDVKRFQGAL